MLTSDKLKKLLGHKNRQISLFKKKGFGRQQVAFDWKVLNRTFKLNQIVVDSGPKELFIKRCNLVFRSFADISS